MKSNMARLVADDQAAHRAQRRVLAMAAQKSVIHRARDFGQEEMKAAGMTTLPRWEFTSFDAAAAFVRENPGRYVVKPSGRAQAP